MPIYNHVRQMWFLYGPAAVSSLVILPLVVVDVLRLSHRFAGPMLRLRRAMRNLSEGKEVKLIQLRDDDFWQDFADDFNSVAAKLRAEKHPPAVPADAPGTASRAAELVGAANDRNFF